LPDNVKKNQETPPALDGNTVWLSGKEGDGYGVALAIYTPGEENRS